jgi:hypothetical protein
MRVLATSLGIALSACGALSGCAATPPPSWASGGAPILIPEARWQEEDGSVVEIRGDGAVLANGGLLFSIDPVGRVYDSSGAGVAVLLGDGRVGGADKTELGRIGVGNASPPNRSTAWISVQSDGDVLYVDDDGERHTYGHWDGCQGNARRTCTFVTHLVTLHRQNAQTASTTWVGFGVGMGIYR